MKQNYLKNISSGLYNNNTKERESELLTFDFPNAYEECAWVSFNSHFGSVLS